MNRGWLCMIVAGMLLAAGPGISQAQEKKDTATTAPAARLAIADPASTGLVVVEYTLQFDKGKAPAGRVRGVDSVIREERPLEVEGWLVGPTEVVTATRRSTRGSSSPSRSASAARPCPPRWPGTTKTRPRCC